MTTQPYIIISSAGLVFIMILYYTSILILVSKDLQKKMIQRSLKVSIQLFLGVIIIGFLLLWLSLGILRLIYKIPIGEIFHLACLLAVLFTAFYHLVTFVSFLIEELVGN